MIRNYIFDLVGVLADFGTKRIFQHFIELGATDVWELNNEMDLGYLSGEEFLQLVQERCKGVTVEEFRASPVQKNVVLVAFFRFRVAAYLVYVCIQQF